MLLPRWHRITLFISGFLLWLGGIHLYVKSFLGQEQNSDYFSTPSVAEPLMEINWHAIHSLIGLGFVFICGGLLTKHIPLGWRTKRNRLSGTIVLSFVIFLTVSGWQLTYGSGNLLRDLSYWLHLLLGTLLPALVCAHIYFGRRTRRK